MEIDRNLKLEKSSSGSDIYLLKKDPVKQAWTLVWIGDGEKLMAGLRNVLGKKKELEK